MGAGSFGQVLVCLDMKQNGRQVAIKINKNSKQATEDAQVEAKILWRLQEVEPDQPNTLKIYDSFTFRRHFFIVTEPLGINLYSFTKLPSFRGMKGEMLKSVTSQLLRGLQYLTEASIIHCDLKPENILFTDKSFQAVKIIDFGSACTKYENGFTYVQSRYYRAPEVVIGIPYSHGVDMWSLGCILCEMVTGRPVFPARDEKELLEMIMIRIGCPSEDMMRRAKKSKLF